MKHLSRLRSLLFLSRLLLQQEGTVLAAVFVVVVSLWGFMELADEVLEGSAQLFDLWVMRQLRCPDDPTRPIGPSWLVEAGQEITALGGIPVLALIVLAVVGYLLRQRAYGALQFVLIATIGGILLSFALKQVFGRERPDVILHLVTVHTPSFPSGHAMLSAVVYLTLGALLAQLVSSRVDKIYFITVAIALTLLIGVSRVYLGVHYPTDVLAGWSMGLAWALLCWIVARFLRRRGAMESVGETM
ncbi:MAG: phosphatase PAP2 family protein [Candidatus Binatia bacterium]